MTGAITFSPFELFVIGLGLAVGVGLIFVWREDTWHRRVETLRAEFGRELRKRDDEILRLSARMDAIMDIDEAERRHSIDRARERERTAVYNVSGDLNNGGDIVGGEKRG